MVHQFFFIKDPPDENDQRCDGEKDGDPGMEHQRNACREENDPQIPGMPDDAIDPARDQFVVLLDRHIEAELPTQLKDCEVHQEVSQECRDQSDIPDNHRVPQDGYPASVEKRRNQQDRKGCKL